MSSRLFSFLGAATLVASACVSPTTRRPTTSAPASPSSGRAVNLAGPWTLRPPSASQQVSVSTDAVVAVTGDGNTRTDTLRAVLGASFVWAPGAHRRLDGLLRDYRVQVGAGVSAVPAGLQPNRPFSAEARTPGSALSFRLPPESSVCEDPALSVLQGLHDAWLHLPDTLLIGRTWVDTVQTLSCRDHVVLSGTAVRRFRVLRAEIDTGSHVVVVVDRTSRGRLVGEGSQFGEQVTIEGESSGNLRYSIDPLIGRPTRASGASTLSFALKSKRRNQTVRQESALALTWIP